MNYDDEYSAKEIVLADKLKGKTRSEQDEILWEEMRYGEL